VTVVTGDGQSLSADLRKASERPESEDNVLLTDATMVYVGRRRNEIPVSGQVRTPQIIQTGDPIALSAALARAGGLTGAADAARVEIIREEGAVETVDARPLVGLHIQGTPAPDTRADPLLQPGDSVLVNRRYARVIVLGAVKSPGSYDFDDGDQLVDAVALAGGFDSVKKPILESTVILRREGDAVQVIALDMKAALAGGQALMAQPLRDRDIVYVPQGKPAILRDLVQALLGVSQFVRLFVQ
jgi:protein involved in polysaccharide export with SLBB domain